MIYRNISFRVFVLATALMSFLSTNGMEDKEQQSFTPLPLPPSNHQPLPLPPINPDVSRHFGISQEQWSSMSSEEQRSIMDVYRNDMKKKREQEQQEKEDAAIARAMAGEDKPSSSVILPPPPPRGLPLSPTSSLTSNRPNILDKQAKLQRISEYVDQMSEYMKPSTNTSSSSSSASFDDRGIMDIMSVDQHIWDHMSIDEKFQAVSMFRDQLYAEIATDQFNEEDERIRHLLRHLVRKKRNKQEKTIELCVCYRTFLLNIREVIRHLFKQKQNRKQLQQPLKQNNVKQWLWQELMQMLICW